MPDLARVALTHGEYARRKRAQFDTLWQDIADYEYPRMANFTVKYAPGTRRNYRIVNSHGVWCARENAVRVNGFLAGGGQPWFDLKIAESKIANDPAVRAWLDQVRRIMYSLFNAPESGFEVASEQKFRQLAAFGNGPVFIGEDARGWPKYRSIFLGQISVFTDDDGKVVSFYRAYEQTAWELVEQFGKDVLPDIVLKAAEDEPQKMFECQHEVRPVRPGDLYDFRGRPYIETYVLKEKITLLSVNYYYEFPLVFPRWECIPDEAYGRGPGEDALQDVKMLQEMDKVSFKHAHKNADPMVLVEDDGGTSPRINQRPGAMISARMNAQGHWNVQPLTLGGSSTELDGKIARVEALVERHFYLDAFKMVDKISKEGSVVNMTATEFSGRQAEQMRMAGPALARLRAEDLYPTLSRTARSLARNKKIPPPPPQLRGAAVYPEYCSPLANAQYNAEGQSVMQFLGAVIPLRQVDDRALDGLNMDRTKQVLGRGFHVPQEIFDTPEELAAKQQAQQAQADAQQQTAQAQMVAAQGGAALDNAKAVQTLRGVA